ncbi:MAG: hypothetical protein ABI863_04385 [Ginsengibacter sp.]
MFFTKGMLLSIRCMAFANHFDEKPMSFGTFSGLSLHDNYISESFPCYPEQLPKIDDNISLLSD